ncbi:hypothetical protein [Streptomyces sp. NPDC056291]|uniref:hypothetical protein n=1 Tax=Streptomyces sp. NPDC056291 TaxID=3345772 RepID=UPI0035DD263D
MLPEVRTESDPTKSFAEYQVLDDGRLLLVSAGADGAVVSTVSVCHPDQAE